MRLTSKAIMEFQDLHEKHFGNRPTEDEAERDMTMLIRLVLHSQMIQKRRIKL